MNRALDAIAAIPWAIQEQWLRTIISIAGREGDLKAVEARRAERLQDANRVYIRDGVAVVPVIGPIFRYANLFSEVSGATSVQTLAQDLTAVIENRSIRAVILNIDSPGGQVNGTHEFAEMVYNARGTKPIIAYVGGMAASAGYWIASAADEIVADPTAALGSIGVVMSIKVDEKDNNLVEIVSTASPKKRLSPKSEEGRSEMLRQVDALADVFLDRVARNRGVDIETVISQYGQGGCEVGSAAVAVGLADRLGSFESLVAELANDQPNFSLTAAKEIPMKNTKATKRLQKTAADVRRELQAKAAEEEEDDEEEEDPKPPTPPVSEEDDEEKKDEEAEEGDEEDDEEPAPAPSSEEDDEDEEAEEDDEDEEKEMARLAALTPQQLAAELLGSRRRLGALERENRSNRQQSIEQKVGRVMDQAIAEHRLTAAEAKTWSRRLSAALLAGDTEAEQDLMSMLNLKAPQAPKGRIGGGKAANVGEPSVSGVVVDNGDDHNLAMQRVAAQGIKTGSRKFQGAYQKALASVRAERKSQGVK